MGVYKGKKKPLFFSDVERHVQTTCGWRHVFEQLAGMHYRLRCKRHPIYMWIVRFLLMGVRMISA